MAAPPQQFCVRWNSYQSNLQNAFPKLLTSEHFVDVTLACESEMLKCHKVVLSACSTYFEKLLLDNPCQHPIIFMKDMKFQEMQLLVDFMYKGEVNVTQDDLPSLLKSAEALQIRGLCGSEQLLNQQHIIGLKAQVKAVSNASPPKNLIKQTELNGKTKTDGEHEQLNPSSSDCDSNDAAVQIQQQLLHRAAEESEVKEETNEEDSYFEGDGDMMDTEYLEEEGANGGDNKTPDYAIANVSCQYDGSPDENGPQNHAEVKMPMFVANISGGQYDGSPGSSNRRIRRSDEELRRAAECITRGQTFQTVSDQFNIPISTIRFYMARKGILPRRKRGRACAGPTGLPMPGQTVYGTSSPGNTSPIGPPYHIVHYKLPALGVSKLK